MKAYMRILSVPVLWLGMVSLAQATCTGSSDPCNEPRNGTILSVSATKINVRVQNSETPNADLSRYFFQATTLGAPQNVPSADRSTVIVFTADFTTPTSPNNLIEQTLGPLLASSLYNIHAKACPPGSVVPTAGGCSAWLPISSETTDDLTNAGFDNVQASDTQPLQFTARTIWGVPPPPNSVLDQDNVVAWVAKQLSSTEVGNCTFTKTFQPFPDTGAFALTITSADCATLRPNRPYTLTEGLYYDPTQEAPNYVTSTFYTQAKDAVALPIISTSITHCSATLPFQNAAANPANPADTTYWIHIGGVVAFGAANQTKVIGGTGIFSDKNSMTFTNLQAGQTYNPTVAALNRGGSPWRDSGLDAYDSFQTVSWDGTFSVSSISTNSARFNVLTLSSAGITKWQMVVNGSLVGSETAGLPPASILVTGLNPNTLYSLQIRLTEASGCFSELPANPAGEGTQFYTRPAVPSMPASLAVQNPRALLANWTDPATPTGNPNGSTYSVQTCTTGFGTGTCQVQTATKASTTPSATITSSIQPETAYFVRVKTVSASGVPANDSAYLNIGSTTTFNEAPNVTSVNCVAPTGPSTTCTGQATDNGLPGEFLLCHWSANNGATVTAGNDQLSNGSGACPQISLSLPGNGSYVVTLEVRDNNGVNPFLNDTDTQTISLGQTAASITITPIGAPPIATGNSRSYTATVRDQFNGIISNAQVTWSVNGGGSLSPDPLTTTSSSTVFTANAPGSFTLTASLAGVTPDTEPINVIAAGAYFVNPPTFTVDANGVQGTASALGNDNVLTESSLSYTWSVESGPGNVVFVSQNGVNASKNMNLRFTKAGTYVLRCTLSNSNGSVFALTPSGVVPQVLTGLIVSPSEAKINVGETQVFTAAGADQFNDAMPLTSTVTWSNNVNPSGANASFVGATAVNASQVVATSGGRTGIATVTVDDFTLSGAKAYPVPYKSNSGLPGITFDGLGTSAKIRVFTVTGKKVFEIDGVSLQYPWDVKNSSGERLASGVYFYVIESPNAKKEGKLVIIQ